MLELTFSSRLASLLLRWKTADTIFVVLRFSFKVWRYSPSVAMSLLSAPSNACQSPLACMIARSKAYGEEGRYLQVALSVAAFLELLTKSVNLRATAATRTGCVRHEVGHQTPFSGCGSKNAAEDLRPNLLQLNTEGLTADKISVIEQIACKTHCTTADKLVIPNFSLAGSILSRNHCLVTFVHERLEWSLVDQSPE